MSTIESHINKVEGMGMKADLVIIDYVDLLSSRKKNRERKEMKLMIFMEVQKD